MKFRYTIRYFLLACFMFTMYVSSQAQAGRDGAMQIRFRMEDYFFESGDDVWPDQDEFSWNARIKDYPDVDGAGFIYTGLRTFNDGIFSSGPYFLPIPSPITNTFTYGAINTLGPQSTPEGMQMGFEAWEDDCFDCAGGTICLGSDCSPSVGHRTIYDAGCYGCACDCFFTGGDDQYCNHEMTGSSNLPFRFAIPNRFNYLGLTRSGLPGYDGGCSGDNPGVTLSTFWTPPCPDTMWADRPVICDPGYVTLQTGGAVFGGTYRWYRDNGLSLPTFIQETADSFFTIYVPGTSSYRVYTKNPVDPSAPPGTQEESWSYRLITIFIDRPTITSIIPSNPLCADSLNGSILVNATSLVPGLEYSIDNGATWQASGLFSGLGDGIYLIKVRTAYCEVPPYGLPVQLLDPSPLTTTIGRVDSVTCFGLTDGAIELSVSGGTGPFSYSWNTGAVTEDISDLSIGSYSVTVVDNHGCNASTATTVYQPTALTATISGDSVSCAGTADGAAVVVASGGTTPYTYLWSNGATTASIAGLPGATYTCVIRDRKGCQISSSIIIFEAAPLQLSISKTNVTCYHANDGIVSVDTTLLGGIAPYNYAWSPSLPNLATVTGVAAGTYAITVTDAAGCTASGSITVTQPDSIRVSSLLFDVECNGRSNGRIDITVSGGTTPYAYSWTGPITSSSEDINMIPGGVYNLAITDGHGCIHNSSYTINEPAPITSTFTSVTPHCYGETSGSATVNISGGTAPYFILWSTFATTATINSITAGTYTVIITDDNGCMSSNNLTITQPDQLYITNASVTNCRCHGDSTGQINFVVLGGIGTLNYSWSTGRPNTNEYLNAVADYYSVFISDDSGCFTTGYFDVTEPTPFVTNVTGNSPTCSDNSTGFAVVSATGSTPPYTYNWSTVPAQTGIMAIHLTGGVYVVTISDINACTTIDSVTIIPPSPIIVSTAPTAVKCFAGNDGSVVVTATGGNAPYKYILNGILQTDSIFTGLTAANYIIVVEDNNGCIGNTTFSISEPTNFTMAPTASPRVIQRGMTTQLNANISSPLTIIRINWSADPAMSDSLDFSACPVATNCATPIAQPNQTTLYTIEAINSDTCSIFDTVRVIVLQERAIFIPSAFSPNGDNKNETFDFQILGAKSVEVNIYNRYGELMYNNANQSNGAGQGWNGQFKGAKVAMDSYVYQFDIEFWDGTKETMGGTVTIVQ